MIVHTTILTKNPCYKNGGTRKKTKGLVLHSVGTPQPSASVFVTNWNKASYDRACVHGFIDANTGEIYQTLPWNWRAWHCGGSGNDTHIGVEMCESSSFVYKNGRLTGVRDKDKAIADCRRTIDSAVELFAKLCVDFNLDPLTQICSHSEGYKRGIASNHADPEHMWNYLNMRYTMDDFRQAVYNKMKGEDDMTKEEVRAVVKEELDAYFSSLASKPLPGWATTDSDVQKAISEGVFDGSRPLSFATRVEAVAMAMRASK